MTNTAKPSEKCQCVYANARNTPSVAYGHEMCGYVKEKCARCVAAERRPPSSEQVGDWVLVPARPTNEILDAGNDERHSFEHNGGHCSEYNIYREMIKAAPAKPCDAEAYDRSLIADMLGGLAYDDGFGMKAYGPYTLEAIKEQIDLLVQADNNEGAHIVRLAQPQRQAREDSK